MDRQSQYKYCQLSDDKLQHHWPTQKGGGRGCRAAAPPPFQGVIKKNVDTMIARVLHYLLFSLNQPLKSADDWYIGILGNIHVIQTYEYVNIFPLF